MPGESGRTNNGETTRKMKFVACEASKPCKKMKIDNSAFGRMILMQYPHDPPIAVIQKAAAYVKASLEYKVEGRDDNL